MERTSWYVHRASVSLFENAGGVCLVGLLKLLKDHRITEC